MPRRVSILAALRGTLVGILVLAGCNSPSNRLRRYNASERLDAAARAKIERGIIEPGFTPEMVYLALGKPSEPAINLADATTNGTWIYRDFNRNDRDFVRAGFRRRVVFDPDRRSDVVITEPVDPREFPQLQERSLHVTFRDGHVVEIRRTADL